MNSLFVRAVLRTTFAIAALASVGCGGSSEPAASLDAGPSSSGGEGGGGAFFQASPKSLGFCIVDAKMPPASSVITVTNIGTDYASLTAKVDDGAPFVARPAQLSIAPGASATVEIAPLLDRAGRFTSPSGGPFGVAIEAANGASTRIDLTVAVDLDVIEIATGDVQIVRDITSSSSSADLVLHNPAGAPVHMEVATLGDGGTTGVFGVSTNSDFAVSALSLDGDATATLHVGDSWVGTAGRFRDDGTLYLSTFPGECPAKRRKIPLHARARDRATAIAAGGAQTCVRGAAMGQNYCWGDPNLIGRSANDPSSGGLGGIGYAMELAIVAGRAHSCQLLFHPECWGRGQLGQLGDGMSADSLTRYVEAYPINPTASLFAGFDTTCAVTQGGDFLCWGRDPRVANATSPLASPMRIALGITPTSVGIGAAHVCGLAGGAVACIGANDAGQLGDGTNASTSMPTAVVGLTTPTSISAGSAHTCALASSGAVACWGDNARGQLGDGTGHASARPIVVAGVTDAIAVAAGAFHTCVVRQTGTVVCWGANESGQLGDGTMNDALSPVAIGGLSGVTLIATGHRHTCAIHHGGDVSCWGDDSSAQLGNGTGMPGLPQSTPQRAFGFY